MNVEETEALTFTYDRPLHISQIHIKLSTDQTELSGKMYQREIAYLNFGTLRNTADFISALGNVSNVKISDLISPENRLWLRRTLLESYKIMKTTMGEILLQ